MNAIVIQLSSNLKSTGPVLANILGLGFLVSTALFGVGGSYIHELHSLARGFSVLMCIYSDFRIATKRWQKCRPIQIAALSMLGQKGV